MSPDDEADQREDVERGEDDRIVAVERGLVGEITQPVEREDRLDQQRTGEEGAEKGAGKPEITSSMALRKTWP